MSLPTPYATVAEADLQLVNNADWNALDDDAKTEHLSWGKVYIDDTYSCFTTVDSDGVIFEELVHSNVLLAEANLTKSVFARQSANGPLEETEVRAGSTLSRKRYKTAGRSSWQDPFPQVTALISQIDCSLIKESGFHTVPLIRA